MKKDIITILALIMLISCGCSIERKNPTDPLSSNYIGWHFIGTIGSFSVLADFVATPDHIYCVDSYDLMAYKYKTDGTYVLGWGNNPPPAAPIFTSPNALCVSNQHIIIMDRGAGRFIVFNEADLNDNWPLNVVNAADRITAGPANIIYAAVSNPPAVKSYTFDFAGKTITAYHDITLPPDLIENISEIAWHYSSGNLLIADSAQQKISVITTAGDFVKDIFIGKSVQGFALKGSSIYVPTEDGIMIYSYETGLKTGSMADYGNGSGKVIRPSIIRIASDYVFTGEKNSIKLFGP